MRPPRVPGRPVRLIAWLAGAALLAGCGLIKHAAVNSVASMLSQNGTTVTSDNDPELIEAAVPFTIKLYESLLDSVPKNAELLQATCALATEYAYAFLQSKADMLGQGHHDETVALRDRALNMYLRGKGYCVRALEQRSEHITALLMKDPEAAVKKFKDRKKDVALLYWSAASWGGAISLGKDKPAIAVDFPVVRALADRALALDESWSKGAIHEMMITLDSLPEALGGNADRARKHFDRAVELQHGLSPGPYVALALNISVPAQNRDEFVKLVNTALAVDPEKDPDTRLVTLLSQRLAHALLDQLDQLFVGHPSGRAAGRAAR
jgi:tetratricopeptide (TPR) repeat protein